MRPGPRLLLAAAAMAAGLGPIAFEAVAAAQDRRHARLFRPQELGDLEGPDREAWQKPDDIMDALGISDGSIVADLGVGAGWFTVRVARRVGPRGKVYAEDIQKEMIEATGRRIQREGLRNVQLVLGTAEDPGIPPKSLDAALVSNTYAEIVRPVEFLKNVRGALKPAGRLGILDFRRDGLGPGPPIEDRVDPEVVINDARAAGFRLISKDTALPFQYLLVFGL